MGGVVVCGNESDRRRQRFLRAAARLARGHRTHSQVAAGFVINMLLTAHSAAAVCACGGCVAWLEFPDGGCRAMYSHSVSHRASQSQHRCKDASM